MIPYGTQMRKLVGINEIYTDSFGKRIPITQCPFAEFARELIENPIIDLMKTKYADWLRKQFQEYGIVWDSIKSEDDILHRVVEFRNIIHSIKKYGYKEELAHPLHVRDGKIYGTMTAQAIENGYLLVDAHHRISILIAMGVQEFNLTICE